MSSIPRARSRSTTKLPRNPAPPVTTTRLPASGEGEDEGSDGGMTSSYTDWAPPSNPGGLSVPRGSERVLEGAAAGGDLRDRGADLRDGGGGLVRTARDASGLHRGSVRGDQEDAQHL